MNGLTIPIKTVIIMSNSEIAHLWAQQTKESKTSGNMSFVGRSLYSYRLEIGRFIEGKVIYAAHGSTRTTVGKHYPVCRQAISHLEAYAVHTPLRNIPDNWKDASKLIFLDQLTRLKESIEAFKRKQSGIFSTSTRICEQAVECLGFYNKYVYRKSNITKEAKAIGITIKQLNQFRTESITEKFWEQFGVMKFNERLQKDVDKEELDRLKNEAKRREYAASQSENMEKWRNGESVSAYLYNAPCMLRINGDIIETSHGAKVPVSGAIQLWKALKAGQDVRGAGIGDYKVTSVSESYLVVGCHNIPMIEVRHIAIQLGLENPTESLSA